MENPFDRFDAPAASAAANPFDQFDAAEDRRQRAIGLYKAADVGLANAAAGIGGSVGDVTNLGARGIQAGVNLVQRTLGMPETTRDLSASALNQIPTSASMSAAIQRDLYGGATQYQPQNTLEEYTKTAGEFAPALFGGESGLFGRLAQWLVPAITSETAGQLTKGTAAEPYARTAGALAAPLAVSTAQRAVTPLRVPATRAPFVQTLQQEGVPLSAGAITGSRPLQWFEQALGDIPGAGGAATRSSEATAEGFTRAALARTGEMANRATPEVIDRAFTRIGNNFDRLAARNVLHPDSQFGQDMQAGLTDYRGIVSPPNRAPVIENFEAEIGVALARNGGTIPGDVFQSLTSRLERAARAARGTPEVADTLRDMRSALNDAMERSMARLGSPDLGQWREARRQYRNMLTIERAATGAGENAAQGLISPSALRNAVVNSGRRAYARGQGDLAELARVGEAILKPLPQSGTAPRTYAMHIPAVLAGGLGALFGGMPGAAGGYAAALAGPPLAGRILMSRPAQAYLGNQLLPHPLLPARRGLLPATIAGSDLLRQ